MVGYDLARALLETGRLDAARSQVTTGWPERTRGAAQPARRYRTACQPHRCRRPVPARGAHGSGRRTSLRLGRQPPPAAGLRSGDGSLRRLDQAVPPVGETAHRPRHRPVLIRVDARTRSDRSATRPISPSDPRPYQFLGEMYGVSPEMAKEISTRLARFVQTQPKNALAHFPVRMRPAEGRRWSRWPGRSPAMSKIS